MVFLSEFLVIWMEKIISDLRNHLQGKYGKSRREFANIADNESIVGKKALDSFEIMEFLTFTEGRYDVSFDMDDYAQNKLESLNKIGQCILEKKRKGRK
jgi:acyl carrier protein